MENTTYSNNRVPAIYSWARSQDGTDRTAYIGGGTTGKFEVLGVPWGWIYCHNYHHPYTAPAESGPFPDYELEFMTRPDVSATIILYNF